MKSKFLNLVAGLMIVAFGSLAHASGPQCERGQNIVELATNDGRFTTLIAAIKASDLQDYLSNTEGLTVFAPTDEAFAKLPTGTLEALLADKAALRNILTYHVVGAKVPAAVAMTLTEATMLNGQKVEIRLEAGKLFVNDSQVVLTDIVAKNGIVHAIDAVLIP